MNGCLVIHGLTGTPATVAVLRDRLIAAGFCVSTPCLAGHGGSSEDLARSSWRDWYETVRIAFQSLRKEAERVYYAGISLGALLGLKLAIDEGWGVRAMALLATPMRLGRLSAISIPLVRYSPLRWIIKGVPKDFEKSVGDPDGRALYEEFSLPVLPARATFELCDLVRELEGQLVRISSPLILLHGELDRVAPPSNVEFVRSRVSSDIVESAIFPRSRHVITMDSEKEEVASKVVDFFKRFG